MLRPCSPRAPFSAFCTPLSSRRMPQLDDAGRRRAACEVRVACPVAVWRTRSLVKRLFEFFRVQTTGHAHTGRNRAWNSVHQACDARCGFDVRPRRNHPGASAPRSVRGHARRLLIARDSSEQDESRAPPREPPLARRASDRSQGWLIVDTPQTLPTSRTDRAGSNRVLGCNTQGGNRFLAGPTTAFE